MKKFFATMALAALGLGTLPAQAADVDIHWQNPDGFKDVEASNSMGQKKYEERVFEELAGHFRMAAERRLPPGQQLIVVVNDVDLAGYVDYFVEPYYQGVRIVDDLYFPSLSFDWQLLDEGDKLIAQGSETLKDMSFLRPFDSKFARGEMLYYEKRLIDRWMQDAFFDPSQS